MPNWKQAKNDGLHSWTFLPILLLFQGTQELCWKITSFLTASLLNGVLLELHTYHACINECFCNSTVPPSNERIVFFVSKYWISRNSCKKTWKEWAKHKSTQQFCTTIKIVCFSSHFSSLTLQYIPFYTHHFPPYSIQ